MRLPGSFAGASNLLESMHLLSELRYPTRWYSKLIAALLALSFFSLLAAGIISRIRGV